PPTIRPKATACAAPSPTHCRYCACSSPIWGTPWAPVASAKPCCCWKACARARCQAATTPSMRCYRWPPGRCRCPPAACCWPTISASAATTPAWYCKEFQHEGDRRQRGSRLQPQRQPAQGRPRHLPVQPATTHRSPDPAGAARRRAAEGTHAGGQRALSRRHLPGAAEHVRPAGGRLRPAAAAKAFRIRQQRQQCRGFPRGAATGAAGAEPVHRRGAAGLGHLLDLAGNDLERAQVRQALVLLVEEDQQDGFSVQALVLEPGGDSLSARDFSVLSDSVEVVRLELETDSTSV